MPLPHRVAFFPLDCLQEHHLARIIAIEPAGLVYVKCMRASSRHLALLLYRIPSQEGGCVEALLWIDFARIMSPTHRMQSM